MTARTKTSPDERHMMLDMARTTRLSPADIWAQVTGKPAPGHLTTRTPTDPRMTLGLGRKTATTPVPERGPLEPGQRRYLIRERARELVESAGLTPMVAVQQAVQEIDAQDAQVRAGTHRVYAAPPPGSLPSSPAPQRVSPRQPLTKTPRGR
jgi:hypothetical protein